MSGVAAREALRRRIAEIEAMVEYYKRLGVNPLSLATGCAVKVDLERVVYPAFARVRERLAGMGLEIAPREDADIFPRPRGGVELHRRIYRLGREADVDPGDVARIAPERAIVLVQVYQGRAGSPEEFLEAVVPVYEGIARSGVRLRIGKGHSIVTPFPEDEFMLVDYLKPLGGRGEGYTAANNDTIHIVDPTRPPTDYTQTAGALSNTLNDLFVLGAHRDIRIAPVLNAPTGEVLDRLWSNVERYARSVDAEVLEVPQPRRGRLLIGATVIADSRGHPPTFYDKAEPGDLLVATRPFGELAPINVFLAAVIDEELVEDLEAEGISIEEVERAKNEALETIARPNKPAAEAIEERLPTAPERFDRESHVIATTDVTGPGIYVVWELAQQMNAWIDLWEVPLLYPKLSRYAASRYILPNATSGTNGAFIIVASPSVAEDLVGDLRRRGYPARVIGEVKGKGRPQVTAPESLRDYVTDPAVLGKFTLKRERR